MASGPGRGRNGDDDELTAGSPPFSDEGMRRIIYGQDREGDSRSAAFDDDTAELEADLRERRSLVPIVTALAAVFCFGAIVWYAYTWGTGKMASEELPVVRAEPMPEKVKPEQPGGMEVPYQDKLVLNEGAAGAEAPQVERLLPAPETPQPPEPMAEVPETAPSETAPSEMAQAGSEAPLPAEAAEAPLMAEAPEAPAEIPAPPEAPVETADAGIVKPIPKPETAPAEGGDQIAALLEQEPLETANGQTVNGQTAAPAQTAALTEGDVVLQLSSVKSEAAASQEWARLQKAHPDQLGGRKLSLEAAEVKGTTYYRVQTGPFANRDVAAKVCAQLKARNQDCLVKQR
ncbi:SPOR domain-containing protein [Pelagibius marinus]|uniref:SPOR domain-containing protein n=1 Tax=Pelagibius marinus TaxID=2762760 RepID=UPI001872A6C3|nr:SPOR domain-containing protein [Pelagibius marinus]